MNNNAFSHITIDPEERIEMSGSTEKSEQLSELFQGYDRQQEIAKIDPNQQTVDPEGTLKQEAVSQQEYPLYQNPLLKIGVVGGAVAAILGIPALLYLQGNKPTVPVANNKVEPLEIKNPTVSESDALGEVALGKQIEDLKLGQPKPVQANPTVGTPTTATTNPTATTAVKTPTTAPGLKTAVEPTPVTKPAYKPAAPVVSKSYPSVNRYPSVAPQPIARFQPIAFKPQPVEQAPTAIKQAPTQPKARSIPTPSTKLTYNPQPTVATVPTTPAQDLATWKIASTSGSFGSSVDRTGNAPPVAQIQPTTPINNPPPPPLEIKPTKNLNIGSKSIGNTTTPIQVAAGNPAGGTVSVSLQQPLLDRNGNILVPAGSQVEFKVQPLDNGWINATSTKIYLIDGTEINAPGAINLSKQDGEPLIADSRGINNSAVANQEGKSFVIGALQSLGANLTAPTVQSTINAGISGVSSSTNTTNNPNPFGALIKGGFDPLAQQQLARANAATQELLKASKIWFVPDGTVVRLTVIKSIAIPF